jgi:hypothetical protein
MDFGTVYPLNLAMDLVGNVGDVRDTTSGLWFGSPGEPAMPSISFRVSLLAGGFSPSAFGIQVWVDNAMIGSGFLPSNGAGQPDDEVICIPLSFFGTTAGTREIAVVLLWHVSNGEESYDAAAASASSYFLTIEAPEEPPSPGGSIVFPVVPRQSSMPWAVPAPGQLKISELAINAADGILYGRMANGAVVALLYRGVLPVAALSGATAFGSGLACAGDVSAAVDALGGRNFTQANTAAQGVLDAVGAVARRAVAISF